MSDAGLPMERVASTGRGAFAILHAGERNRCHRPWMERKEVLARKMCDACELLGRSVRNDRVWHP